MTLGSGTIYLHPCTPAYSFSESIMKCSLPSNILLSLQPCRKEHHCLHYHPEDPAPTLWVIQCLGFGNGKVLDEILEFTLQKRCILAGTRKLSSGATTIITTKNAQVVTQIMVVYEPFFMAFCLDLQD